MHEIISASFMLIGAAFMVLAGVGIFRMPDLFNRMQTTSKASTLGMTFMMLAVAVHFMEISVATRALAIIIFTFLTVPIATHMIGRAGYIDGVRLWHKSVIDQLKGRYHPRTHELESPPDTSALPPPHQPPVPPNQS